MSCLPESCNAIGIDTNDTSHAISWRDKHDDYNWMIHNLHYIVQWDARRDEIFIEVQYIISDDEYMECYWCIMQHIITPNSVQVHLCEYESYTVINCKTKIYRLINMATFTNEGMWHIVMLCYYKDQLTNIIINEWKQR